MSASVRHGLDGLAWWLAGPAAPRELEALFPCFCRELVRSGIPVQRASLGLEVLHPELSGLMFVWMDDSLTVRESARAGVARSPAYRDSPTRVVDETERPFRRRLDVPAPDFPLLEELRSQGATDYLMLPLPFLDRSRTAVMSFATHRPGGFSNPDLDALDRAARLFSPYAERHVLRRIAIDLLDTYVGPRTGSRIIEGRVERGDVERIEAAIWFADLKGFTRLSEDRPLAEVLGLLNAWYEIMVSAITAEGGEVLKFIGDALLAIFPPAEDGSQRQACRRAVAAARAFCAAADEANRKRTGPPAMEFRLILHHGEVAYGNVGAPRRLDFTVIGPAVNEASRMQGLAKALDRRVVLSGAFADVLGEPVEELGAHPLRDVAGPRRACGLPGCG